MKINESNDTKIKADRLNKLQRKIDHALSKKTPCIEAIFSEAYELIEMAMKQGLSQKDVIALVNETYDLKLHAASFRKLLTDERSARARGDRVVLCPMCKHPLAPELESNLEGSVIVAAKVADKEVA